MSIPLTFDRQLIISVGNSRKATSWSPLSLSVSELYARLETPMKGTETIADYLALPKSEQDDRKDVGGFVGGSLNGPRRKAENVKGRDILTLDIDNIPPYQGEIVRTKAETLGCGYAIYSTRKDRPVAPRKRFIAPLSRTVTVDEYDAISRRIAEKIGIEMCDPTTFEAHRLMYWPSCCSDSDYQLWYKDAPPLDVDAVLATYADWHDWTQRPQVPGANNYQKLAVRQGDPESKSGLIGAFCRVYDIYRAMADLLPGIYEPVDNDPDRFTYLNGSTTGGAIIYDNGKFLFSHHATDPCGGKLVNAADLVRLHKFGYMDDNATPDTPTNKLPSYKAFIEFASADKEVSSLQVKEQYEAGQQEFAGIMQAPEAGTTGAGATQGENGSGESGDPNAWLMTLQVTQQGAIKPTIDNICIILDNDPLLKGKFALNKFAAFVEIMGSLPWASGTPHRRWSDTDTSGLYWYLEKRYDITKRGNIDAAFALQVDSCAFNRVTDYLNGLMWDGTPRLDTLFIDYLGAEDNEYNRAVCRKAFTAAVARAMVPGCKYDNMLILCGRQGLGKSTILDKMSRGWFNDSIRTFEGKEASELLQGVWLVEVAELDAFRRTDVARIKQFLSLRADRYRAAYGRNVQELPRCCVFFGTCNERDFLQDTTGNRRFWPVDVGITIPAGEEKNHHPNVWDDLSDEVIGQIWAEAKARWQTGEQLYLTGEVERASQEMQERHRDTSPLEGLIAEFLARDIPTDWQDWPIDRRRDWWAGGTHGDVQTMPRDYISVAEIWCELFGRSQVELTKTNPATKEIRSGLRKLGWNDPGLVRNCGISYGKQRIFRRGP